MLRLYRRNEALIIGTASLVAIGLFWQFSVDAGLIKMFFGLTLFCFLYMLGESWPTDIKIILSGIWLLILFKTEFAFAR